MKYEINLNQITTFFNCHTKDYNDDEYLEIRLIGSYYIKKEFETLLREKEIVHINKKQLFFNKYELDKLKEVLNFDDYAIIKTYKICYSLNPRIKKSVLEHNRSGYEAMRDVRCIGFDFELKNHTTPSEKELRGLKSYVDKFILNVCMYGLSNPGIIRSGRGYHLLYYIFPQRITNGKKRWYKSLVEFLCNHYEDDNYRLDPLKDFTRVFSLPGSVNHKVNRLVLMEKTPNLCSFILKNKEEEFVYIGDFEEDNVNNVEDLLEWKILATGKVPSGQRHQLLVLPLKIWLYENQVKDWKRYERIINKLYNGNEVFNPSQFRGAKYKYSKGAVMTWVKNNLDWIKENNIEV